MNKEAYKNLLAYMESNSNYNPPGSGVALGKYQFLPTTLNYIRDKYNLMDWSGSTTFLNSPGMQELYMTKLLDDQLSFIERKGLTRFLGTPVIGSMRFVDIRAPLNIYGMLAGMHLAGDGSIENHFENGSNPNDGLTSLTDYMAYFSYKLNTSDVSTGVIVLGLAFIGAITLYYQ